jgi:hypothetical protein
MVAADVPRAALEMAPSSPRSSPPPASAPDAPPGAGAALLALHGDLGDAAGDVAEINSALAAAGYPPNEVQRAVSGYTGLSTGAVNSLLGLLSGQPPTLSNTAPLVAAGLALIPAIGPVAIAAVAAALPVIDFIAQLLSPAKPSCTWTVGSLCVTSVRPYGPGSRYWQSIDDFLAGATAPDVPTPPGSRNDQIDAAFPFYRDTILCELARIGDAPTAAVAQFLKSFYAAWKANASYALNGFQAADEHKLLQAVADAWNTVHDPGAGFAFRGTVSWYGLNLPSSSVKSCLFDPTKALDDPAQTTYVSVLLNGDVDGHDQPPVSIHTGALRPGFVLKGPIEWQPSPRKPSGAGGVATAAVATAGVGLGAWLLLGRPLSIEAAKLAFTRAFRR